MTEYALLPDSAIHPEFGRAVGATVAAAARDLGLKRVGISWIYHPDKVNGRYNRVEAPGERTGAFTAPEVPDRLFLHPLWIPTAPAILHECRHIWQHVTGKVEPEAYNAAVDALPADVRVHDADPFGLEADADAWAADALTRLELPEIPDDMPRLARDAR